VGGIRRIAFFSTMFALCLALSVGTANSVLADPQAGSESAAPAASGTPSSSDEPASLPQDSFFSSLKQAFNKDFDREVVRGYFDQGTAPNGHRYYCLVDPKTGKRETNGVLGQTFSMPGGVTGIKDSSVSLYRCADAEKQGLLVTAGYSVGTGVGTKAVPPTSAASSEAVVPMVPPAAASPSVLAPDATPAATAGSTADCASPAHRQFDFWLGDWDVFDGHSHAKVARVHVTRTLDDCVLLEEYRGSDGHEGESFSIYDGPRGVWHQTWVTNRGQLLVIEGSLRGGAMELSGPEHLADGAVRLVRGTWQPSHDGVREVAVRSTDGGKTWTEWFDLEFRPHRT
jgi:hypothetical protein